ncbi:J domain-containing protein [Acinetobacter sp. ANC 4779]|nr:J domain-containing protein [Acinetobacter sp. ANC 4779]TCB47743.1 J domain-containing protein [Acinetobacter sp. ANC 4779]
MKHFSAVASLDESKRQYKKLAFKNHPDRGGNTRSLAKVKTTSI